MSWQFPSVLFVQNNWSPGLPIPRSTVGGRPSGGSFLPTPLIPVMMWCCKLNGLLMFPKHSKNLTWKRTLRTPVRNVLLIFLDVARLQSWLQPCSSLLWSMELCQVLKWIANHGYLLCSHRSSVKVCIMNTLLMVICELKGARFVMHVWRL